jgi:hypothetical protein
MIFLSAARGLASIFAIALVSSASACNRSFSGRRAAANPCTPTPKRSVNPTESSNDKEGRSETCSKRSWPQNTREPTNSVGTPNTPFPIAALVSADEHGTEMVRISPNTALHSAKHLATTLVCSPQCWLPIQCRGLFLSARGSHQSRQSRPVIHGGNNGEPRQHQKPQLHLCDNRAVDITHRFACDVAAVAPAC